MAKTYSKKSQLQNLGPLQANASGSPDTRGDTGLPPEATALLNTISGTESKGDYNVIYRGDQFKSYDAHPKVWVNIPGTKQFSSAAGKYQFIAPTWNKAQKALDLPDFTPASQDKAAWWLAQHQYKTDTGRDLLADLQAGGTKNMSRIARSLSAQWDSLPSGGNPLTSTSKFAEAYDAHLGKVAGHVVPPVGIPANDQVPNPLPAPAPLTAPGSTGIRVISVNPDGSAVDPADEIYNRSQQSKAIGLGGAATKVGGRGVGPIEMVATPAVSPAETRAEQQVARQKAIGLPGRAIIQPNGRTPQDEQNDILSGYRNVQQGNFPAAPNAPKPIPYTPPAATRSGQIEVGATETVRPNGTSSVQPPAGTEALPAQVRPNVPALPATSVSDIPKYITTTQKVLVESPTLKKGQAFANDGTVITQAQKDAFSSVPANSYQKPIVHEQAPTPAPTPKYRLVTKTTLNPAWVTAQAAGRAVAPAPATVVRAVGLGGAAAAPAKPSADSGYLSGSRANAIADTNRVLGLGGTSMSV